ncbi:uncharacterized protein LAESUDRAFT_734810 [Laetiporus sulphureus 93-53]|uniref:DUF6570 domain-containing protein n=1 Tax=Laetiporus sulphureus 93-53 TaxID=1314785 RepID=A0A165GGC1_9APHY|nr:uncharacterized protein LAESUDRAFT_734810 [Laetiporus sulphureus 93-53]KZT10308.1 hypothetical protein LAESUDRAFT_734810 [Laetiporus sulphureus 93-53]
MRYECSARTDPVTMLNGCALVNGLWLGDVPPVLRELTFVEQMLIAKVWHNLFIVKVTKGQWKMIANAIAFSQSVKKMYNVLPLPRCDLDEVLAILFTNPCRPSEEDFKCTPLLVCHHALMLNHCDYADVSIAEENLSQYLKNEPPAMSVHEVDEEWGTNDGPCPFVMHGLSTWTSRRRAVAIRHAH